MDSEDKSDINRPTSSDLEGRKPTLIRREIPKAPGVYVKGSIYGMPVWCTADTGASRTIVSVKTFKNIQKHKTVELDTTTQTPLEQADGSKLDDAGTALLDMELGNARVIKDITVADISDEVLLGLDISESFDVLTSSSEVIIDGIAIPAFIVKPLESSMARLARDITIPALSEIIVDVHVDCEMEHPTDCDLLIEPVNDLVETYSILMATSLVRLQPNGLVMVRIMNPQDNEVPLKKNSVIGTFELSNRTPHVVMEVEEESEESNYDPVRRLNFDQHSIVNIQQHQCTQGKSVASEAVRHITNPLRTAPATNQPPPPLPAHLQVLFEEACSDGSLTQEEQDQFRHLLIDYAATFSVNDDDLGLTTLTEHAIETGEARPVKQAPRRPPMALVAEEKKAIDKLLRQGVIRKSNSPWASPIVLVQKKNGDVRPCVDYRKLNQVTIKDAYPLPRIQECLDSLSGSVIFSTLDMTAGYNQIPIREKDISKTAFVSRHGLFEFCTAPFGLTNMPATFQRVMELALRGLSWTSCLIYLDDVIVFGTSVTDHLTKLQQILERLRQANFKLKPTKCELMKREVSFLGHIVSNQGVRPNVDNVLKVQQWPEPENVTEIRQFLGLASYYRRFVRNFAMIARPLTDLTKKESKLVWTDQCKQAFNELKTQLTGPEIMAYPNDSGGYILDTDASDFAVGAVLSQIQEGQERVVAYASRSLNKAEKNYCVTDKELLAILYFTGYFRCYLLGRAFLVRTDHQALKWLFSLREPKGRIARWIEVLSAFDFSVEYRAGKKHANADGLSRCPNPRDCDCDTESSEDLKCGPCRKCKKRATDMASTWTHPTRRTRQQDRSESLPDPGSWSMGFTPAELRQAQECDDAINQLLIWKNNQERPMVQL